MFLSQSRKLNLCNRHGQRSVGRCVCLHVSVSRSRKLNLCNRHNNNDRSNIFEVSGDDRPRRFNLELRKSSTTFFDLRRPSTTLFDLPEKCPWPFICIYPKNVHQPWPLALNPSRFLACRTRSRAHERLLGTAAPAHCTRIARRAGAAMSALPTLTPEISFARAPRPQLAHARACRCSRGARRRARLQRYARRPAPE